MAKTNRNLCAAAAMVGAAGSFVCAANAGAQTVGEDFLEFGAQVDLRYDSNVVTGAQQRALDEDFDRSDQIITPSLTASINKTLGRNAIRATALVGYDFHLQNSQLNSERLIFDIAGLVNASICELRPGANFQRRQSRTGDRALFLVDDFDPDNVLTVQEYKLDAACGRSIGLRPIGGLSFRSGRNSSELRQLSDYDSFTYYGGIGYKQPSIGTLDLYASHEKTEYENRLIEGELDEYEVRRIGGTFARDIGARWNARAGAFYIDTDAAGVVGENYSGLGWNIGLNGSFSPRARLSLDFAKDVQPVLNNDSLYMKQTLYGVRGAYVVNERWTLNAGYSLRDRSYVFSEALPPSTEGNLLEDQFNLATVSADYNTASPLSFTLYGGYENRSADNPLFDYDGYYAGVTVKYLLRR